MSDDEVFPFFLARISAGLLARAGESEGRREQ